MTITREQQLEIRAWVDERASGEVALPEFDFAGREEELWNGVRDGVLPRWVLLPLAVEAMRRNDRRGLWRMVSLLTGWQVSERDTGAQVRQEVAARLIERWLDVEEDQRGARGGRGEVVDLTADPALQPPDLVQQQLPLARPVVL